ncbi:MAG TPA: flagellar motor protein MotB [Gaiellales bacterium]|jgi:chemotaxis protein MotB
MSGHGRGRGRRRGGHGGGHEGGDERWLLTYADMITLLMALFMVLFSISSVNISKYQVLQHALQKAFIGGVLDGGKGVQSGNPTRISGVQTATPSGSVDSSFNIFTKTLLGSGKTDTAAKAKAAAKEQNTLLEVQRRVENYATKHGFAADISTSINQRGLVIRLLTNNLVFDSGQATLKPTATPLLMRVSRLLVSMHIQNPISVEGNTDNVPISGGEFPSNWELSTARADAVLEFLLHHGISPKHLAAVGYADQNPVAPNTSDAGRALNRRVDIVVIRSDTTSSSGGTSP